MIRKRRSPTVFADTWGTTRPDAAAWQNHYTQSSDRPQESEAVFVMGQSKGKFLFDSPEDIQRAKDELDSLIEAARSHAANARKHARGTDRIILVASFLSGLYFLIVLDPISTLGIEQEELFPFVALGLVVMVINGVLQTLQERRKGEAKLAEYNRLVVNAMGEELKANLDSWIQRRARNRAEPDGGQSEHLARMADLSQKLEDLRSLILSGVGKSPLQTRSIGRPPDPLYDQAFEKLASGMDWKDAFSWYCEKAGIDKVTRSVRNSFNRAMKRRAKNDP